MILGDAAELMTLPKFFHQTVEVERFLPVHPSAGQGQEVLDDNRGLLS